MLLACLQINKQRHCSQFYRMQFKQPWFNVKMTIHVVILTTQIWVKTDRETSGQMSQMVEMIILILGYFYPKTWVVWITGKITLGCFYTNWFLQWFTLTSMQSNNLDNKLSSWILVLKVDFRYEIAVKCENFVLITLWYFNHVLRVIKSECILVYQQ